MEVCYDFANLDLLIVITGCYSNILPDHEVTFNEQNNSFDVKFNVSVSSNNGFIL